MEDFKNRLAKIRERISSASRKSGRPEGSVRLIVVTKTRGCDQINRLFALGENEIGENRVQEIIEKKFLLNNGLKIHLIGHLQRNKVSKVVPLVNMIHSIDSIRLTQAVEKACKTLGKILPVLVQVNTSNEAQKNGVIPMLLNPLVEEIQSSPHLELIGLMTIGKLGGNERENRACFTMLRQKKEQLVSEGRVSKKNFTELSMGMSGDFEIAISEGATMVRIGSAIMGTRDSG